MSYSIINIFAFVFQSWYHYYGTGDEPKITLTLTTLLVVMFALGLAIGVVLAVGALLYFQVSLECSILELCTHHFQPNIVLLKPGLHKQVFPTFLLIKLLKQIS
jgi:hypothetical protein